jgi:hypothetical protein
LQLPALSQASQAPLHAELQQRPSAQNALLHSFAAPHVVPSDFLARHSPAPQ